MIGFRHKGDFSNMSKFIQKARNTRLLADLDRYGEEGVAALKSATPVDTGLTADSWYYEIVNSKNSVSLVFKNSNVQNGVPIAIILQYGHGTRNGGWVEGKDYINPTIQPIFDKIAKKAWGEVTKL